MVNLTCTGIISNVSADFNNKNQVSDLYLDIMVPIGLIEGLLDQLSDMEAVGNYFNKFDAELLLYFSNGTYSVEDDISDISIDEVEMLSINVKVSPICRQYYTIGNPMFISMHDDQLTVSLITDVLANELNDKFR